MKKFLSVVLAVLMLLCSVPLADYNLSLFDVNAEATSNIVINGVDIGYASGSYFTKNGKSCVNSYWSNGRCHYNGVCESTSHSQCNCMRYWPTGSSSTCQVDLKASQCFAFARYCQWIVYGYHDGSNSSKFNNLGSLSKANSTASKVKELLYGCAPATHVRTSSSTKGYAHSVCIVSTSDSNIVVADCNSDGYCRVRLKTYTWSDFASYMYGYGGIAYAYSSKSVTSKLLYVSFDVNGGSISSDEYKLSSNVVYNKSDNSKYIQTWTYGKTKENGLVNASTLGLAKEGYTFAGWGTKSSGGTVFDQNDTSLKAEDICSDVKNGSCSKKLYAIWTANTLDVSFNANGGSISSDTYKLSGNVVYNKSGSSKYIQTWTYGKTKENGLVNASTLGLTRTGYTFSGWGTSSSGGTIFDQGDNTLTAVKINSSVKNKSCSSTLYAIWTPNTLDVSFNANGGSISSSTYKLSNNVVYNRSDSSKYIQTWNYGKAKEHGLVNDSTLGIYKTGYTFSGWGTSSSGGTIFNQGDNTLTAVKINSSVKNKSCSSTLYAIWKANSYHFDFNTNGGKLNSTGSFTTQYGKDFQFQKISCTRTGYTLVGWTVKRNNDNKWYVAGQGWCTDSEITSKGYSKKIYTGDQTYNLDTSWIDGISGDGSYTFYAVWKLNVVTLPDSSSIVGSMVGSSASQESICSHKYDAGTVIVKATCCSTGVKTYTCAICNTSKTETIAKDTSNHTSGTTIKNEATATCTIKGYTGDTYCNGCNTKISDGTTIAATGHTEVTVMGCDATCTKTGLTDGVKCSVCNEILTAQEVIPVIDHTEEITEGYAATCTKTGLTDDVKCAVCSKVIAVQTTIAATGHKNGTISGYTATCTEPGLTDGVECFVCGEILIAQKEIPATGHTEETVKGYAATCTKAGLTDGEKCSVCDETLTTQKEIAMLSHTFGEWTVVTAPTISAEGVEERVCTACGEKETRAIEKLSYIVGDVNNDGEITAADARLALRISAGLDTLESVNTVLEVVDYNNDKQITAADARLILRKSAGLA